MQLEVGRASECPPLPEAVAGDELEWSRNGEERRMPRPRPKAPESLPKRKRPRKERPAHHGLIVGAREHFDAAKVSDVGYLRPSKHILVDVYVSPLTRALDLANEIFLAFEDRGHHVTIPSKDAHYGRPEVDERLEGGRERYRGAWGPKRPTVAFIGTVPIGLSLYELSEQAEVERREDKYVRVGPRKPNPRENPYGWIHKEDMPTGRLCLRATSGYWHGTWERKWQESKPGELVGKSPQIVKEIEEEIPAIVKMIEEGERQHELERQRWEIQQQKWKKEEEERIRDQNLKESREELFAIIEAWALAKRIEAFFEDADRRTERLPETERQIVLERLSRARELLGGVDALKRFIEWKSPEERPLERRNLFG